jgi:acetyl esterase/lipase
MAVRVKQGLSYGSGERQKANVYLPTARRPGGRDTIVLSRGGGWIGGSEDQYSQLARKLAGQGYVVVDPQYPTDPKAAPAAGGLIGQQVDSLDGVARWLAKYRKAWNLSPKKAALIGQSAGAQLALTAAAKGGPFRAVAAWSPPSDLRNFNYSPAPYIPQMAVGATQEADPARWADYSPITHASQLAKLPIFIGASRSDPYVNFAQQVQPLVAALRGAGGNVRTAALPGNWHGYEDTKGWAPMMSWLASLSKPVRR